MLVRRKQLIAELESVRPGLCTRNNIQLEYSHCFVFIDGEVTTFNDDIACRRPCCLHVQGAIYFKTFLRLLKKLPSIYIKMEVVGGELRIDAGSDAHGGFPFEQQSRWPIRCVKMPKRWKPIGRLEEVTKLVKKEYREHIRKIDPIEYAVTKNKYGKWFHVRNSEGLIMSFHSGWDDADRPPK